MQNHCTELLSECVNVDASQTTSMAEMLNETAS